MAEGKGLSEGSGSPKLGADGASEKLDGKLSGPGASKTAANESSNPLAWAGSGVGGGSGSKTGSPGC